DVGSDGYRAGHGVLIVFDAAFVSVEGGVRQRSYSDVESETTKRGCVFRCSNKRPEFIGQILRFPKKHFDCFAQMRIPEFLSVHIETLAIQKLYAGHGSKAVNDKPETHLFRQLRKRIGGNGQVQKVRTSAEPSKTYWAVAPPRLYCPFLGIDA